MDEFWMVYVEGGRAPSVKHSSPESASREAKRLASETGREAHVLRSVHYYRTTRPVERVEYEDEIPF